MAVVTIDDFMSGLFAGLALNHRQIRAIRSEAFYEVVERAYDKLREAPPEGVRLRFLVARHPIHGDSPDVDDAVHSAAARGLVSIDNPSFQDITIRLTPDDARARLAKLPGGLAFWSNLAESVMPKNVMELT